MSEKPTEQGHTPGPLRVEVVEARGQGEWHYWSIIGPNGFISGVGAAAQRGPIDMESNEAYARLFAAAPALKEALAEAREAVQAALNMVETSGFVPDWDYLRETRAKIDAALSAAPAREGE